MASDFWTLLYICKNNFSNESVTHKKLFQWCTYFTEMNEWKVKWIRCMPLYAVSPLRPHPILKSHKLHKCMQCCWKTGYNSTAVFFSAHSVRKRTNCLITTKWNKQDTGDLQNDGCSFPTPLHSSQDISPGYTGTH